MREAILVLATGKDQAGVHPEPLEMMMLYLYLIIFERDLFDFSTISEYAVFIPRNICMVNKHDYNITARLLIFFVSRVSIQKY